MRRFGRIPGATATLAIAGLMLSMGCATTQDRVLGLGEKSPLAGEWYGPATMDVRWTAAAGARHANTNVAMSKDVVIRDDGSFALDRTMLAMMGDLHRLRKTGDQVPVKGSKGQAETLRVVWCEYTSTTSQMVVEIRSDEENVDNADGSTPTSSDCSLLYSSARLNDDGTLSYHRSILLTPTQESVVAGGILKRVPSRDMKKLARQMMRDYPLRDHIIARRVKRRRLKTKAGNEFILITPKGKATGLPLVVIVPGQYENDNAELRARWWRHQVDNLKIAVAIPVLDDRRMGYDADENWALGKELTKKVTDVTPAAKEAVKPTGTCLLGRGLGATIAHVLWQRDNSAFDALLITDWHPRGRQRIPKPDAKIDMSKPVYFFWKEPEGRRMPTYLTGAVQWYRKQGFKNVFGVATEESALDKHHRYMAAVLIGQKPDQVTVQRVTEDYPRPIPRR